MAGGFRNIRTYVDAHHAGQRHTCHFRKVPSQASVAGWWVDLSMAAGNPKPNYYVGSPLEATALDGANGLFHGFDKSPASLFVTEWALCTPTAALVGQYKLLDYLVFYPFIDLDDADPQTMDNDVTLPRYTDGAGVMAMMVATAPTTGSGTFTFDYVNQDGVQKTSPTQFCTTTAASIASIATSQPASVAGNGPFLTLASGDTGIRSVVSHTNLSLNGGLGTIVLVKPLADHMIREINIPSELMYIIQDPEIPRIYDGAYLNMIMNCAATVAAGQLVGRMKFVWN